LLDEGVEGCVGLDQLERSQFGFLRDEFNSGFEMENLGEASGGDALTFDGLAEGGLASLFLDGDAEQVAFEGDAGIERVLKLALVIDIDVEGLFFDADGSLGKGEFEIALSGREHGILTLRLEGFIGGFDQLLCGERFVERITEVQLHGEGGARSVGVFINTDDVAFDVLDLVVVLAVSDSGRDPGEELRNCAGVDGFGLDDAFASDFYVQILSTGQTEGRGKVDKIGGIGSRGVCKDGREEKSDNWGEEIKN